MADVLLAIDQGTTSSRAIIFDARGNVLEVQQKELELFYPHKGWVEQDANAIWDDVVFCAKDVLQKSQQTPIAIGITNQRETTVVWDRASGEPVYHAIVWQDRRTADICEGLQAQGHEAMIAEKTGLLLDPYFSATKIAWILDNVEGARVRAEKGELAFGTVECWLLWKLTGGERHISDVTNACRTMLYNVREQKWDEDLLALFKIPASMMPQVYDNAADFGAAKADILGVEIPVCGMAGDQQSALIGQGCFEEGMIKSTYGTGCFALMNIGAAFKPSQNRLLTTIAYRINGAVTYAVEGSIFTAGAAVQWLRDGLNVFDDAAESEAMALSVADNNEVYFVPAFTGLGAPYWDPEARAAIVGLSRESTKAHIVRAALEAQGYQTLDLVGAMEDDSGHEVSTLRADGGLTANDFVCQFLADMLQKPVEVPKVVETTAWGAAVLAGLQAGVFNDLSEVSKQWSAHKRFEPIMTAADVQKLYDGWSKAVKRVLD